MNRTYIIGTALALFCAACSEISPDRPVAGSGTDVPGISAEGLRLIDYTVSGQAGAVRAFSDGNLDPSERISSLIYLLYDSQGKLVKERLIPDIGPETEWPLRRPGADGQGGNMTWEQREALKDTLSSSRSYKAVFIANADPELFGLDGMSDGNVVLHYKSSDSGERLYGLGEGVSPDSFSYLAFEDIRLSLPPVPFSENNMFYADVVDIPALADGEEGPDSHNVVLGRIVSRTDISRIDPDTDYSGTSDEAEAARAALFAGATENLYAQVEEGLESQITEIMENISEEFYAKALVLFNDPLNPLPFTQYSIDLRSAAEHVFPEFRNLITDYLLEGCVADESLRIRMQQWAGAEATLNLGSTASEFSIADMAPETGVVQVPSVSYTADENGVISTVGFGDGSGTFNTLSSIDFGYQAADTGFSLDMPAGFSLWHGLNVKNTAVCNPVSAIRFVDTGLKKTDGILLECDLQALLGNDGFSGSWRSEFGEVMSEVISENGYGSSFADFAVYADIIDFGAPGSSNLAATASLQ